MSKDKKKTLKERQLEFFESKGMNWNEAMKFIAWHGVNFDPNNFSDYQPDKIFKEQEWVSSGKSSLTGSVSSS